VQEKIRNQRLYEQVVERVSGQIFDGRLKKGDQLPNERALADEYGVSRTVIREAMKTLAKDGLIEVRTGHGTFVVDDTAGALKNSIQTLMRIGQDADRLRELVELRELLEPGVAALAARRAERSDLDALQASIDAMNDAMDDSDAFIRADNRFHKQLALASRNRLIPRILDSIVDLLHELRGAIFQIEGGPERGQAHHRTILAAIRDRDATAARLAMEDHLAQVKRDSEAAARKRRRARAEAADQEA
jgi:GntR family transcriptional regulator, transcriptional repressor for pyruvate dehydrogenase complex